MADTKVDDVAEALLSLDTAAYTSGDLMCQAVELERVCVPNYPSFIESVTLLDYDDNGAALDLLFFRAHPGNLGTVNAAVLLSAAAAEMILCWVTIGTGDYIDLGTRRVAQPEFYPRKVRPADGQTSVWVAAVSRTSQTTYASGRMLLKVGVIKIE